MNGSLERTLWKADSFAGGLDIMADQHSRLWVRKAGYEVVEGEHSYLW